MISSIKVLPNQSMLDVILQGCGTLEAGMQVMHANGRSISDYPAVGDALVIDDEEKSFTKDAGVLRYLKQNDIVIGTLDIAHVLSCTVILKPVMRVVPATATDPSVLGEYQLFFRDAPGFINVHPIPHSLYPFDYSILWYLNKARYMAHEPPFGNLSPGNYMDDKSLYYYLVWEAASGYTVAWIDLGAAVKTATFVDVMGNEAYSAPVIVMNELTQDVEDYLIADIEIEVVSATSNTITLRLKRSHPTVSNPDFSTYTMSWLNDAAGGSPDPADPSNPDKTILVLSPGIYTFGVGTAYTNGTTIFPPSAFTEVVEIA